MLKFFEYMLQCGSGELFFSLIFLKFYVYDGGEKYFINLQLKMLFFFLDYSNYYFYKKVKFES